MQLTFGSEGPMRQTLRLWSILQTCLAAADPTIPAPTTTTSYNVEWLIVANEFLRILDHQKGFHKKDSKHVVCYWKGVLSNAPSKEIIRTEYNVLTRHPYFSGLSPLYFCTVLTLIN